MSRESRAQEYVDRAAGLQVEWELHQLGGAGPTDPADRNRDGIDPPLAGPDPEGAFKQRGQAFVDWAKLFDSIPQEGDSGDELAVLENAMTLLTGTDDRTDVSDPNSTSVDAPREEFEHLASAKDYIGQWDGDAAEAFFEWIDELPGATYYQYTAASALRGAITAERDLWKTAGENFDTLLDEVGKGLDAYEASIETPSFDLTFGVTVLTAVLGGAAAIASGGSAMPLVIGAINVTAAGAKVDWKELGSESKPRDLATQPILIVEAAGNQADQLNQKIVEAEEEIGRALTDAADLLWKDRDLAHLPRPNLANAPKNDNGFHDDSQFGNYTG